MKQIELSDGQYSFTMNSTSKPVATVKPGEKLVVITKDGPSNQLGPNIKPSSVKLTFPNPQMGPIYVDSAKPGDTLSRDWQNMDIMGLRSYLYSARLR